MAAIICSSAISRGRWERLERLYQNPEQRASLVSAILFRRHEALQFLVPMLHDDERGRRGARVGPGRFDHQEALAVGRHVVRAASVPAPV